jgi:hypothetical protein
MFLLLAALSTPLSASAQTTAFTYQGYMNDVQGPATGTYDFRFLLYDRTNSGTLKAGPLTNSAIAATNGIFTVLLDFGSGPFAGTNLWLEIAVRTNGSSGFYTLTPRQPLTPSPIALWSSAAQTAVFATTSAFANGVASTNITGVFRLNQLPGTMVTNGQNHLTLSGMLTGNGTGLTNVPGSLAWIVTGSNVKALPNTGYVLTNANPMIVTLPVPLGLHLGDIVRVTGGGAGGWQLQQNSGQYILGDSGAFPQPPTTVGSAGYLSGVQYSAATVEYVGNGQFLRVNSLGDISAH